MGNGIKFDGSNASYAPPEGVSEDQCKTLHVFKNGACIVSCWELSADELAEINRSKRVFLSVWSGQKLFPVFIGSESAVHGVVADFGAVWKLNEQPKRASDGCDICDNEFERPGCPYRIEPDKGILRDAETNPPGFTPIAGINPQEDDS